MCDVVESIRNPLSFPFSTVAFTLTCINDFHMDLNDITYQSTGHMTAILLTWDSPKLFVAPMFHPAI